MFSSTSCLSVRFISRATAHGIISLNIVNNASSNRAQKKVKVNMSGGQPVEGRLSFDDGESSSPLARQDTSSDVVMRSETPDVRLEDTNGFPSAVCTLFHMSSPRRIGASLRSAAASQFPDAVDRIVRESRSQSFHDAVEEQSIASEDLTATHFTASGGGHPAVGDSFTNSFASTQAGGGPLSNNSLSATAGNEAKEQQRAKSKSFFASFIESKLGDGVEPRQRGNSYAPAGGTNNSNSVAAALQILSSPSEPPRKGYRCKISIIGDSGSGKSTFHHCFTHSVIKVMPEVAPSPSSSSTVFCYKSATKREKLDALVVDAGPHPLTCGLPTAYDQTNLFVLTMSLAGVKQRTSKRFLSFGNEPSAIVHTQDKIMLRSYIARISAQCAAGCRAPMLAIIGTCKDLLTDQARESVETVLRELNHVVQQLTRTMPLPPRLIGCFAISCVDHSCVPENRGGPKSINELWSFLCDICLKEATQLRAMTGDTPVHMDDIQRWSLFRQDSAAASDLETSSSASSPSAIGPTSAEVRIISDRLITFIRRAKSEMHFVMVHMRSLRQVAFSLGVFFVGHLDAILNVMARDGEVLLLHQQPRHVGGREDSVVLWPHYAHRAVVALIQYQQALCYPLQERARVIPGVNIEECDRVDPKHLASHGIFLPKLLVCLSRVLPQSKRSAVERAETFALLLLSVDFVFQRRCVRIPNPPTAAATLSSHLSSSASPQPADPTQPEDSSSFSRDYSGDAIGHRHIHSVEYVAPSLVTSNCSVDIVSMFDDKLLRNRNSVIIGGRLARVVFRSIRIEHCPPDVFSTVVCRWGPFSVPGSRIYKDAVWLKRPHAASDSSESSHDNSSDDDESDKDDHHHGGSSSSDSLQRFMSSTHSARQTRCFARALWHQPQPSSGGTHDNNAKTGGNHNQQVMTMNSTLDVRLTIVSCEEMLAVAHFTTTLLRIACHMLDGKYPGLTWAVTDSADCTGERVECTSDGAKAACSDESREPVDLGGMYDLDSLFAVV